LGVTLHACIFKRQPLKSTANNRDEIDYAPDM
jgi:hypothetical protein